MYDHKLPFKITKEGSVYRGLVSVLGQQQYFVACDKVDEVEKAMVEKLRSAGITGSIEFEFTYDLPSFFHYFKEINVSAIARLIGMDPRLLSQYVCGARRPDADNYRKIMEGVKQLSIDVLKAVNKK